MQCPKCASHNVDHASYCAACGNQLVDPNNQVVVRDYAGFWRRFAALIIDSILLAVLGALGGAIIGGVIGGIVGYQGKNVASYMVVITAGSYLFGTVLNWLYYSIMESSEKQATVGKIAMGIIVTDINGGRISFGKATIRYWCKIISAIILLIGYIMAAFTEKKQALHDLIANTLVVKN